MATGKNTGLKYKINQGNSKLPLDSYNNYNVLFFFHSLLIAIFAN